MTGFKLSEEELDLHSADKNAVEFIEVVKDKVTDWINYHHVQVPNRDKIQVFYLSFSAGSLALAIARLIDKNQVIRLLFCNMPNQSKPDVEILVNIKTGDITINQTRKLELFSINQLDQVLRLVYLFLDQNRESASAMYSNKTNTEQFWKEYQI